MEVIDRIKNCKNDQELYYLTKRLIKDALKETRKNNKYFGLLGDKLEVNPTEYYLNQKELSNLRTLYSVNIWNGYIPLNTKIVYGIIYNNNNKGFSCGGYYYYLDDESYVYDFIKYIKKYEIEDELDVISVVNFFVNDYFGKRINPKSRSEMHSLLLKDNNLFFEPTIKHSIKDFYHNGSGQCTEYATIANNLFSVLGIPISCFLDRSHAYNVLFIENGEEYDSYILDYSDCVFVYDEKLRCTGRFPFFKKIENGNKEFIERVVNDGEKIELEDYNMLKINDTFYETKTGKNRIYGVGDEIKEEKKLILSR